MADLQSITVHVTEVRMPKPGQQQYYVVTDQGGFYVWPDAAFLNTLQPQQYYAVQYEQRGRYRTMRAAEPTMPQQPYPAAPPPGPAPVAQAVPQQYQQPPQRAYAQPPQPMPAPAPEPVDLRQTHDGQYRSPMMLFVSDVVAGAMRSGQFPANEIDLLTKQAIIAWQSVDLHMAGASVTTPSNEPATYPDQDYPEERM